MIQGHSPAVPSYKMHRLLLHARVNAAACLHSQTVSYHITYICKTLLSSRSRSIVTSLHPTYLAGYASWWQSHGAKTFSECIRTYLTGYALPFSHLPMVQLKDLRSTPFTTRIFQGTCLNLGHSIILEICGICPARLLTTAEQLGAKNVVRHL